MKTSDNRYNMRFLLTPKLDIIFKLLFTSDTDLLIDLINSVLHLPDDRRITSVKVKNPTILPDEITKKFIILDIRAIDDQQNQYDIEIQIQKYEAYPKRSLYYASRLYADQLETGDDYASLMPVIGIHFLDYEQFPDRSDFHFHFYLRDVRYPELCLTDDLSLHIFELPKFEKLCGSHDNLTEWLHFFNHAHEEAEKSMRTYYKNPAIHRAFDMLEKLSADEQTRLRAEIREKTLTNEVSMLAAARREGEKSGAEKEKKKTAFNMLTAGMDVELICQITGLSEEEVKQLIQ
jgi:predicted transposase/invertase (TIGR01784 family)